MFFSYWSHILYYYAPCYDLLSRKGPLTWHGGWLRIPILAGPSPRVNCPILWSLPGPNPRPFFPSSCQYKQYYTYRQHFFKYTIVYVFWASPWPNIPVVPPDLFLYVNLVAKGAQKLFKTLAPPPAYSIGYPFLLLMHTVAHCVL